MTNQDRIIALIRTLVPALYGVALAWVIGRFEWVQEALDWLTVQLGADVSALIQGVLVAAVIAGYYWVARKLGARFPWLERWLLGRALIPVYVQEPPTTGFEDSGTGFRDRLGG